MIFPKPLKENFQRCRVYGGLLLWLLLLHAVGTNAQTPIDLTRPVGATDGIAASNGNGGATYSIPIKLPPGIRDMMPDISVSYSSQGSGNGYSGHGWTLSPISQVTRSGKNVFHNGISTPVDFTGANDAFVLDGQRLMLISGTNGAAGAIYGTENEQFSKIEALGGDGNSPASFKVTTKSGMIMEYGTDNNRMLTNDGTQTIFWALRKVTDPYGNYMTYEYSINNTARHFTLTKILYTGNAAAGVAPTYQVLFNYNTKTDWQLAPVYLAGSTLYSASILDNIQVRKADNSLIRTYTFAYSYLNRKYHLNSVTESGANGTALNPITFTYGENTTASDVALTAEYGYSTNQNNTGDFDGDGRQDVQTYSYRYNTSNGETWFKWYQIYDYNNGTIGGKYSYQMDTDIPNTDVKVMGNSAHNPFAVLDFDGDGKDDVFIAKFSQNSYNLTGVNVNYSRVTMGISGQRVTEYKKVQYNTLPTSIYGTHTLWKQGGSFFTSGDFDGNGHTDYILIVGINGYSNAYKAFLSTPSLQIFNQEIYNFGAGVNGASGEFSALAVAESKAIIPINFDGDSKTELLVVRPEGSYVLRVYPIPASSGYSYAGTVLHTHADIKTDYKIFPGDFNGDGNTDLFVRPSSNVSGTPWKIFYSNGKAFVPSNFTTAYTIILPGDGYTNGHMLNVGDYDGDGKSDIWHSLDNTSSSSYHVLYHMHGNTYTTEQANMSQSTNTESMYCVGDYNGDGKPDLLKVRNASSTSFFTRFLLARPFKEKNLLVGASSLGHLTTFDYGLMNNMDNSGIYARTEGDFSFNDASYSHPYIRPYAVGANPMYLLAKIAKPNGLGYASNEYFSYEDAVFHRTGRGYLGYKRTDARNDMGLVKRNWSIPDTDYSLMLPDVSQVHLNSGGIMTRTRYFNTIKLVSATAYSNRRFFMKTDRVHTKNWLTQEGTEVLNTYDDYGNVTKSVINAGSSDDFNITAVLETAENNKVFNTYASAPYPGFVTSSILKKTRTGQALITKTTHYAYFPSGLLQSVTDNVGTPIATTVTNAYNAFGHVTQTTTTAPGVTTPVVTYTYDPTGRYRIEEKATGGGVIKTKSWTYDDRFGLLLTEKGTDQLTTTYQYNEFGKITQSTGTTGTVITITRAWETGVANARHTEQTQRSDGSSPAKVYYDILGREIRREKRGFGNQWMTSGRTYNAYGLLASELQPYYSGEPGQSIMYYYDSYGRLVYKSDPTGAITTTYSTAGGNTFTVQSTNLIGQWTSKTSDASGKIISSSDNGTAMTFTYDSYGNQLTAASNGTTFVTNTYDDYGRLKTQLDVNAGSSQYEYDAIGQLVKQTDARSNIQTMAYDAFGRLASSSGTQGTTTYTYYYDAGAGKSTDKLSQVTGFSGDVRTYTYDAYSRLSSESLAAGGTTLTKSYTYDARGNLATTTYPGGFLIRNVYDDNDIHIQTRYEQGATIKTLFNATAMNSRGVYTNYATGNGKTKQVTWDFVKGQASRYFTAGVQDLNMDYEANTINLLSRRDGIRNLTEQFTYDGYDRLTSARVNGVQQFAITYDAVAQGKILQKTDVANYQYHTSKVHAPTDLTAVSGGADPQAVLGTAAPTITYTAFNKPNVITEGVYQLTYTYGFNRQRISSVLKQSGTTIETRSYFGEMEGCTKNGVSSEIYYISAGNGLNNIIVKQGSAINIYYAYTDHLGSILTLTNEAGGIIAEQNFDAWGRKRNPANWTFASVPTVPDWLFRGYTGHEHLKEFNLVNMNSRLYDPVLGVMLSPDNYISNPWSPAGYNRFAYANGNPLKYIDPSGDEPVTIAIIVGAVIGAYTGGVLANNGEYNPTKWDFQNGKTWGWMVAGAVVGGVSGYVGGTITAGGGFMSKTLGIMYSSYINSIGTAIYTGGQTQVSMSFGFGSYNFDTGEFTYLFKKGNSLIENIGYTFGALANLQDIVAWTHGVNSEVIAEQDGQGTPHARHERTVDADGKALDAKDQWDISVSHDNSNTKPIGYVDEASTGFLGMLDYAQAWIRRIDGGQYHAPHGDVVAKIGLENVNENILKAMAANVRSKTGLWGIGKLIYGTPLFGCQDHVAHSLWAVGIPTLPINFHPMALWTQLAIRQAGIFASPIAIQLYK